MLQIISCSLIGKISASKSEELSSSLSGIASTIQVMEKHRLTVKRLLTYEKEQIK